MFELAEDADAVDPSADLTACPVVKDGKETLWLCDPALSVWALPLEEPLVDEARPVL